MPTHPPALPRTSPVHDWTRILALIPIMFCGLSMILSQLESLGCPVLCTNLASPFSMLMLALESSIDHFWESIIPELKSSYKSELPKILKNGFSDALKQFREQYSEVKFPGPIYVGSIQVFSSSSRVPQDNMKNARYRTGKNGTPEGYKNLSEDRGKALQEFILSFIKSDKSIVTDGNTKVLDMNFLGQNGDGTSGPEWDPSKGAQHQDYLNAQYAYVVITFTAVPEPQIPTPIPPKDINDFSIRSSAEGRGRIFINLNLPKLNLPKVNLGGVRLFSTGKDLSCPVWGSGKGYSGFGF